MLRNPRRGYSIGILLGASVAVGITSEAFRSTKVYWWLSDHVVTPLLKGLPDPEMAHNLSINLLKMRLHPVSREKKKGTINPLLATQVFGLNFDSPIGLAAGFDKQASVYEQLLEMGFSFVEIGGVTPEPQPGNPKPRLFRLKEDLAVINRFGLNSDGHKAVSLRMLFRDRKKGILGVNLAKNSISRGGDFASDYVKGVETLGPFADFIVLNVSCPNVQYTKDMKDDELKNLVEAVRLARDRVCEDKPFLIKISPDMNDAAKKKIADIAVLCGVDGFVIANTTSSRPVTIASSYKLETGGLSGKPLKSLALETTRDIYRLTNGAIPIIGVGGIFSAEDAYERIRAGASLVQIYTAFIYEGPGVIHKIQSELQEIVTKDGFTNISQCVGLDVPDVPKQAQIDAEV